LVFVGVAKGSIMANDVVMPSNPPIVPIEKEEFKESSLDANVSQQSCEEKLSRKMVHTRVDHSTWDRRLSFNPHALIIYLKFVPFHGVVL
jgi:hypothetical protein